MFGCHAVGAVGSSGTGEPDGLAFEGKYERGFNPLNDDGGDAVRLGYVRMKSQHGALTAGQQWTADYDLVSVYGDLLETFGGDN